ncbi:hypothetical protein BJ973_001062 [Actinoplanes tereljensis]|uniref:SnoaL-like domain-containing protein n=1 Tax=Paractinoplanes tereljensis TaxID=571912 RepID=A0A919U077_9ACTN|nr:hypothetical protein [Actinoplanes tereljensis]GIF26617.1 hypothetical protein Ate02nite_93470 [Actinoplanes tereljensis]
MPWFPDFAAAAELMRQETRASGRADPVGRYLTALTEGDTHPLEDVWPGQVVIFDPKAGEVRGHRELRNFVHLSRDLLAAHHARTSPPSYTTVAGRRAVVELEAQLDEGVPWPLAVVADSPDDQTMVFRSYFSRHPLDGHHHLRPPILEATPMHPDDVVGRFLSALAIGDVVAAAATFAPNGYLRDPTGATHQGAALAAYLAGGIVLEPCAVTDDGVRCALEYNCTRWREDLSPQAGLAIHDRTPNGQLAAVRLYDDINRTT